MKKITRIFFAVAVSLTFLSGSRCQQYRFQKTYPPPDSTKYAYDFHAIDSWGEVCIAVGNKRTPSLHTKERNVPMIFRSTNGGVTWVEQDPGLPHTQSDGDYGLTQVQQIDSLNAVAAGGSGMIVKTSDGGGTWQIQHLLENHGMYSSGYVYQVNFSEPMTGIVVKSLGRGDANDTGCILTTFDGGRTWTPGAFCPWLFATECHSDGGESFRAIGSSEGPVYMTHDNWKTIDSTPFIIPLDDLQHTFGQCDFLGNDTLVGLGANGTIGSFVRLFITRSIDGGYHWTPIDIPDSIVLPERNMSSLNRSIVFLGGISNHREIVVSMDRGMTWKIDTFLYYSDTVPDDIISITATTSNEAIASFGSSVGNYIAPSILARGVPVGSEVVNTESRDENVGLYPSPASNTLHLWGWKGNLSICDPLGRSHEMYSNGNTLDISSLPSGVYFVTDGRSRAKFVKE